MPLRRYLFPALSVGLLFAGAVQAQVGTSISADGTPPNTNAMLDVQSPATGAGKGILIPRVSLAQRTTSDAALAGGLLDNSGNLRGGAAQGLIVYQTDGAPGLYVNTNATATPAWVHLGEEIDPNWAAASNAIMADIAIRLASNVWAAAGSTTNYLPRTGGTMSGALNMGAQIVTNVAYIDFNGNAVSVGRGANGSDNGAAVGQSANGYNSGAAVGILANGSFSGAAMGGSATSTNNGAAMGVLADGSSYGAAIGRLANGSVSGAAVGYQANGSANGAAIGRQAIGTYSGVAVGYQADGANTNVAIGRRADAGGGTQRIAVGNNVTNQLDDTAAIRGHLYLDGGTGMFYRATFGTGSWTAKAFEIDHPLDPANKVLRHFCLEGPQVWNIYAGNAQLVNGRAVVELPDYYSALNLVGSEIYSLTPIGRTMVWIEKKTENNRFLIGGDQDIEVSWTIKVLRNDPGCREDLRRRPVEQLKSEIVKP